METIAIVDDNESAAKSVAFFLKISGFDKCEIYDSAGALLSEMNSGFRPKIVVSDFFMPEMNGVELLDTIAEAYGVIPGVIMTGYPEGIASASRLNNDYPVLCKGQSGFFQEMVRTIEELRMKEEGVLSTALPPPSAAWKALPRG